MKRIWAGSKARCFPWSRRVGSVALPFTNHLLRRVAGRRQCARCGYIWR